MAVVDPKKDGVTTRLVFPPHLLSIAPRPNPHLATLGNVVGRIDNVGDLVKFRQTPKVEVRDRSTVFVDVVANAVGKGMFMPSAVDVGPCRGTVVVARGSVDVESRRLCPLWNWLVHRPVRLCNPARGSLR